MNKKGDGVSILHRLFVYFLFQKSDSVKGNDKSDKDTHNNEDTEHTEAHVLEGLKKGLKIPCEFKHIIYRLSL